MVRCSILSGFRVSLRLDAVLERDGSHETLASQSRENLFLSALGDHTEWYRFHGLFAEVLQRARAPWREPDLVPQRFTAAPRRGIAKRATSRRRSTMRSPPARATKPPT